MFANWKTTSGRWLWLLLALVADLSLFSSAHATPPAYSTFSREQKVDHLPKSKDLLRIWIVYVNQGDGILIQLPPKYRASDADSEAGDPIDILIDGGASPASEAGRIARFLELCYPERKPTLEYAVISHHDQDHVAGITALLGNSDVKFGHVFHNGLASYRPGVRGFPTSGSPNAVVSKERGKISRGLAFVDEDGKSLKASYLVGDLEALGQRRQANEFQGVYQALADGVAKASAEERIEAFPRAFHGAPFINEVQAARGQPLSGLSFEVLWPLAALESYGGNNWGETINGNSVTFRLVYGEFEMLFTGDHNEKSQERLLESLESSGHLEVLSCDVLKVPHHGSDHALERFFRHEKLAPVVSVASMGNQGFKSKAAGNSGAWQHPSTEVIQWLGGAHRVYCTFIHEQRFHWEAITTEEDRLRMIEPAHILIETDGTWFRIVEIPADTISLDRIPEVRQVKRGDGTRWIKAKK